MLLINPSMIDTARIGRMGELVVELELLARGWIVGNFNATTNNSAGWDLFAVKGKRAIKVRVKAKRPGTEAFRWSSKSDGSTLIGLVPGDTTDFVAAVSFEAAGGYEVYILPSAILDETLARDYDTYIRAPKANGEARKDSTQRNVFLNDRVDGPVGHGYKVHWRGYSGNWKALEDL